MEGWGWKHKVSKNCSPSRKRCQWNFFVPFFVSFVWRWDRVLLIERFYLTSRRRHWCCKLILRDLNFIRMQIYSFVLIICNMAVSHVSGHRGGLWLVTRSECSGFVWLILHVRTYQTPRLRDTKKTKDPRDYSAVTKPQYELTKTKKTHHRFLHRGEPNWINFPAFVLFSFFAAENRLLEKFVRILKLPYGGFTALSLQTLLLRRKNVTVSLVECPG